MTTEIDEEVVASVPAIAPTRPSSTGSNLNPRTGGSVWGVRDFRILAVGEGISSLGDAVTFIALPLLVLALTGSGAAMGIVTALQTLPDLILGLPTGALADRWDRRKMMIGADLGRALLTALIPLSVQLGGPTMTVILLVVFPINALRVVFMGAWTGAIPNLVGRERIGPATSYIEAIFALGFIVGPGIAGVLASTIGPGPTLAIDAASFVVSAAALWLMRTPLQAETDRAPSHIVADIKEGIAFVAHHPTLRAGVAFWGATGIATAGLIPVLTYFVTRDLHHGSETLGLVISAYSVGTLIGALVAARLTRGRLGPLLLGGNLVTGILVIWLSVVEAPLLLAAASFIAGIANAQVLISYVTIRASSTPDELLGRVGSTTRLVSVGLQPIGAATAGVLLDVIAGARTLQLMGILIVLVSLAGALSASLRNVRATPAAS